MTSRFVFFLTATSVIWPALEATAAQCPAIPTAVEQVRPRPFVSARISEMVVMPLEQAIKDADLIVIGTVTRPTVYLSEDQCTLYTDYTLATRQVIVSDEIKRERPGSSPVVIRTWGGETTISGVPVKIYEENIRALTIGQVYLLFLKFNKAISKYEIYDHGVYALEVGRDNRLKPVVKLADLMDNSINNAPLERVIQQIHERRPL